MATSETVCPNLEQQAPSYAMHPKGDDSSAAQMPGATARRFIPYCIFALCTTLYLLPFMRVMFLGGDEGSFLDGAVRILHGQVFARDFFEIVGPGTFYWLAIFFKLFGVTFVAARICLFVTSLGTGLAMYFLSGRICERYSILPCILLVATCFRMSWPAISHHTDSNFFALLSVACVVLWQGGRKRTFLVAAGFLAGVTTCVHQPKGMLLFVAILLWLWLQHRRCSASLSSVGLVAGGYADVIGIVAAYFWSRHALWDLIYSNILWPSRHYGAVNAVPYAQGIVQHYWKNCWVVLGSSFHWTVAIAALLITPLLFIAALPALLPALSLFCKRKPVRPEVLLYWLCGCALWLAEFHRKDMSHLIVGSPLLIILCVHYLEEYQGRLAGLTLQILTITASCLACFNLFLALSAHPTITRVGSVAMFTDDPALEFLNEHVTPGDEIFVYPDRPTYYFLSATKNPTPYSLLMYNYNTRSQFEDASRILERRKVKYVIWNTNFEAKDVGSIFPASKSMAHDALIIEPYLESHYDLVKDENGLRIMERKDGSHVD